jgi:hypothetical protein
MADIVNKVSAQDPLAAVSREFVLTSTSYRSNVNRAFVGRLGNET